MTDVLILGGTGEARDLAASLIADGYNVLSSLAGRVSKPRLPVGAVRIGGFGGREGLADFLTAHRIRAVVDATHPFAARITSHAVAAASDAGVAHLRLTRPAWTAGPSDNWSRVRSIDEAAHAVAARGGRVFLTTGRQDVSAFAGVDNAWFLIRVVETPATPLPPQHHVVRSRGPYTDDAERALMTTHAISLLVTKDSGGSLTDAKLRVAAELGIEVIVVNRPAEPEGINRVQSVDNAADWVRRQLG